MPLEMFAFFSRIHIHTAHLSRQRQGIYRSPELLLDISKPKSKVALRLDPDVVNVLQWLRLHVSKAPNCWDGV